MIARALCSGNLGKGTRGYVDYTDAVPRKPTIVRIAVLLDADAPATPGLFDGILDVARSRNWRLGDETTLADADGVIRHVDCPAESAAPTVTVSTVFMSRGDVRPDSALIHNLAGEHFLERGFHGFVKDIDGLTHLPAGPTACLMTSDVAAASLSKLADAAGRSVPGELAVLGVGDDVLTCERCDPPLSSVDVGLRQLGRRAATRLDRILRGLPVPEADYVLPLGVVCRASTDTLAIRDAEIALAVRFIREHASGPLRVTDVVRAVELDRRTLERRFARALGRSPAEYLRRHRVETAAVLLRSTLRSVGEVASATGFRLPQHLAAAFKALRGQTPSDYRASVQGGD